MIKRKIMDMLVSWKASHGCECLVVKGARQVGKSFIVDAFGRMSYQSYICLDFIKNPEYKAIFEGPLDASEIYQRMSLVVPNIAFVPGDTLVFLDEIQECPRARTSLKYLAIDGRFDVLASGSLLGIRFLQRDEGSASSSVPVGYERSIEMYPLDFEEYLWARGYSEGATGQLAEFVERLDSIPRDVNETMMRYLREYLAIGGMPAVVQAFVESDSFQVAHEEQIKLLETYEDDIARYASPTERVKARACYRSLPAQLARENTKFKYSTVERGGSARKFAGSVDWLEGANMVLRCRSVSTLQFPLLAYEDDSRFRLYASDTGLLLARYGFEMKAAVVQNTLSGPMKGGLYENLVAGMLVKNGIPLRYWMSQNGSSEIEFLVEKNASVVPIEVKASRGSTASLNRVLEREDIACGYKFIDGNVGVDAKKITLPLYLAPFLFQSWWRQTNHLGPDPK